MHSLPVTRLFWRRSPSAEYYSVIDLAPPGSGGWGRGGGRGAGRPAPRGVGRPPPRGVGDGAATGHRRVGSRTGAAHSPNVWSYRLAHPSVLLVVAPVMLWWWLLCFQYQSQVIDWPTRGYQRRRRCCFSSLFCFFLIFIVGSQCGANIEPQPSGSIHTMGYRHLPDFTSPSIHFVSYFSMVGMRRFCFLANSPP